MSTQVTRNAVFISAGIELARVEVERSPLFLRWCQTPEGWVAVLGDTLPEGSIVAANRGHVEQMHMDYSRSRSAWFVTAYYAPIEPQPPADVLGNQVAWEQYAGAQAEALKAGAH